MTTTLIPATDKQVAFATRLAAERNVTVALDALSKSEASALITRLLAVKPSVAAPAANNQSAEPGVYVLPDGSIVKVQPNKAKTNVYALRWTVIGGERLVDATEGRVHGEWTYESGLIRTVVGARKMTLDEAKAFILRYGQCVRCSRHLKAAESVERGIGPVCVQYFSFG